MMQRQALLSLLSPGADSLQVILGQPWSANKARHRAATQEIVLVARRFIEFSSSPRNSFLVRIFTESLKLGKESVARSVEETTMRDSFN
jgi:hypothetical protein